MGICSKCKEVQCKTAVAVKVHKQVVTGCKKCLYLFIFRKLRFLWNPCASKKPVLYEHHIVAPAQSSKLLPCRLILKGTSGFQNHPLIRKPLFPERRNYISHLLRISPLLQFTQKAHRTQLSITRELRLLHCPALTHLQCRCKCLLPLIFIKKPYHTKCKINKNTARNNKCLPSAPPTSPAGRFGAENAPSVHHSSRQITPGAGNAPSVHQILRGSNFGAGNAPSVHHSSRKAAFGAEKHSFLHRILCGTTPGVENTPSVHHFPGEGIPGAENAPFMHHFRPEMTFGAEKHYFLHQSVGKKKSGAKCKHF